MLTRTLAVELGPMTTLVATGAWPTKLHGSATASRWEAATRTFRPMRRKWLACGVALGYVPGHLGSGSRSVATVTVASFVRSGAESTEPLSGQVYARAGNPSWVFMTLHGAGSDESYACELVLKDGRTVPIGSFTMRGGVGSWGRAVDVRLTDVRLVQLRNGQGDLVAKAALTAS